jgi:glutathione S-transferase
MNTNNEFTLYAFNFRSRAERVLWTLRECDLPYEVVRLDPFKGEARTPEFLRLNPSGKVPVLVRGDEVLTESVAIMEYLNDFSQRGLIPSEPKAVYQYRKVVHYGLTEVEPYMWLSEQAKRLKRIYTWPDGTYEESINRVNESLQIVPQWLAGNEHICGDDFSLADIYYYHLLTWATQHEDIELPAGVNDYLRKLEKRAAFPEEMISR